MLKPFGPANYEQLETWVTGREMLFQFAGTEFVYPITPAQSQEYQAKHRERRFYIGYTTDKVAFAFLGNNTTG